MDRLTSKCRTVLYPMVGVILVGSLWALASEKAQSDRFDDRYLQPLPSQDDSTAAAPSAPIALAIRDAR